MVLYFLRHGLAGQHGDPKYKNDSLRPLTAPGKEKIHTAALGMQTLGISFDAILSSPYLRARQTAEIVAQAYTIKNKSIHLTNNLLPPALFATLLNEVQSLFAKSEHILFVGHEPHLSDMISSLLDCPQPLRIDFKKGALCCLEITQDPKNPDAYLKWFLTSTQLSLLAKEKE
jgi:phosphohistidine phosphatase